MILVNKLLQRKRPKDHSKGVYVSKTSVSVRAMIANMRMIPK
jgi:hypothetical protein